MAPVIIIYVLYCNIRYLFMHLPSDIYRHTDSLKMLGLQKVIYFIVCKAFCHQSFEEFYIFIVQYSHREIPISPARLGDTFCCLGDFLSFHRDNRYSQRDIQVTARRCNGTQSVT